MENTRAQSEAATARCWEWRSGRAAAQGLSPTAMADLEVFPLGPQNPAQGSLSGSSSSSNRPGEGLSLPRAPSESPVAPAEHSTPLSSPPFWSSCSLPFYAPKLGAPSAEPGRTQLSNPRPCLQPRPSSKGQCAITRLRRLLVQAPYRGFKEEEAALSGELRLHAHRFPQAR